MQRCGHLKEQVLNSLVFSAYTCRISESVMKAYMRLSSRHGPHYLEGTKKKRKTMSVQTGIGKLHEELQGPDFFFYLPTGFLNLISRVSDMPGIFAER